VYVTWFAEALFLPAAAREDEVLDGTDSASSDPSESEPLSAPDVGFQIVAENDYTGGRHFSEQRSIPKK
jgi:hypothetical protein